MLSPKIYQNLCIMYKFDSFSRIHNAKENVYNYVNILGFQPWPDVVTVYF